MATPRNVSESKKKAIKEVYEGKCAILGLNPETDLEFKNKNRKREYSIHIDHIIPLSENGSNDFTNLIPLLDRINAMKWKKRFPKHLEDYLLLLAKLKLPKVIAVYDRVTHKIVTLPTRLKNIGPDRIEYAVNEIGASVKYSKDDLRILLTGWYDKGILSISNTARQLYKNEKCIVAKLKWLGIYKNDFVGQAP